MPFEKHVLRQDLNIGTESVTECAWEIPSSRRGSTLTPDPHYRGHIPGGVKALQAQSTRAQENCEARGSEDKLRCVICKAKVPSRAGRRDSATVSCWQADITL
ncbi:hypothetical protein CRENBAI_011695 [Crenichthys baileyi]|uniref:Uncharacterized protein n=1 Tax=Crenichthys baileyi TaxID=28760 RepID=A0AAV9RFU1_9TELE